MKVFEMAGIGVFIGVIAIVLLAISMLIVSIVGWPLILIAFGLALMFVGLMEYSCR